MKIIYALTAALLYNTTNFAMDKGENKNDPLNVVCKMPPQDILLQRLSQNCWQTELRKIARIVAYDSTFTNWCKNIAEKSLLPQDAVYQAKCAAAMCHHCALQNKVHVGNLEQYIKDTSPVILREILLKDYPEVLQLLKTQPEK